MNGEPTAEQRYFRTIEDVFIRLRGAPFLLSAADWRLAQKWHAEGIPVDLVCRALEDLFERRHERGERSRVQSLRYCASAIEDAWRERRELGSAGPEAGSYAVDVGARLARLAQALPLELREREAWVARILEVSAPAESAEGELAVIDRQLVDQAEADLTEDQRRSLDDEIAASLETISRRATEEVVEVDRLRLSREAVRRAARLPLLSLFSPDARDS